MNGLSAIDAFVGGRFDLTRSETALLTATGLTGGLIVGVPLLTAVSGVPLLVWVSVVGVLYGIAVLYLRRLVLGLLVALFVTMTFAANVPLASRAYLESMPGMIGPSVWLVHVPLVPLVGLFLLGYHGRLRPVTGVEWFFGAFVVWSVGSAFFGDVPRRDTALYFSLLMFQALLVCGIAVRTVREEFLPFRTVLHVVVIAVFGHALFGLTQIYNGNTFGFTYMGEIAARFVDPDAILVSLGPLGSFDAGLFVNGFVGGAFILASLLLLVLPVLLVSLLNASSSQRVVLVVGFLVGTAVLRLTFSDAARGGYILSLLVLVVFVLMLYRHRGGSFLGRARRGRLELPVGRIGVLVAATVTSLGLALYPTSESGAVSDRPDGSNPGTTGSTTNGTPTNETGDGRASDGVSPDVDPGVVEGVSIPFFDLSNLGIRLQQYVLGLELVPRNPVFGIGGANFQYVAAANGLRSGLALHNIYLALLVETGIVGFLCYTGALGLVLLRGWRLADVESRDGLLALGLFVGMIGYLAFAFWDHLALDRVTSLFPFWAMAGAIVGEYHR